MQPEMSAPQVCEKLVEMYPEEQCSEQGVRRDLSLLEGLSEERALSLDAEALGYAALTDALRAAFGTSDLPF